MRMSKTWGKPEKKKQTKKKIITLQAIGQVSPENTVLMDFRHHVENTVN